MLTAEAGRSRYRARSPIQSLNHPPFETMPPVPDLHSLTLNENGEPRLSRVIHT